MTRTNPWKIWHIGRVLGMGLLSGGLWLHAPAHATETVPLRLLPEPLHGLWERTKPDMNENSRCAAAFDSTPEKMTLRCSVYMRMGAEAERRAMAYCEEDRVKRGIHAPCRIVKE